MTNDDEPVDGNSKIYIIENGECIVEKKYVPAPLVDNCGSLIKTSNQKSGYVKICNIGNGLSI